MGFLRVANALFNSLIKETKLVRKFLTKATVAAALFSLIAAPAHAVNLVGGGATFANPILDADRKSVV